MIKVDRGREFDREDVLRRSPVAQVPGARFILDSVLHRSVVYRGMLNGEVACVWGLIQPTLLSHSAYMWLLTTDIVAEHKFLFIRYSQLFVEDMLELYPRLVGDVILPNPSAVKWLKWLGAEFEPVDGGRMKFVIRRKPSG